MTERPIIFSAPMVRAILEGRKTQTRRILKPQPAKVNMVGLRYDDGKLECEGQRLPCVPGDRLWVREMWRAEARFDKMPLRTEPTGAVVSYEADYNQEPNDGCRGRLRSSIHMPRWASRITLEVKAVSVQRLQEISEEEAKAGGMFRIGTPPLGGWKSDASNRNTPIFGDAYRAFRHLWNNLHGPGSWDANPWVAAISFEPTIKDNKHD